MKKKTLLLVDDEKLILKTLGRGLREKGFTVTTAANKATAELKLRQNYYDIVVTDLVMEGLDGIELLKKSKKIDPDISVIILTAYADMSSAINALREGADDYLLKPCNVDELHLRISRCLEKQNLRKNIKKYSIELKSTNDKLKNYSLKLEEMVQERTEELKCAQEELVRKEKLAMLGLLSSSVGHELRNPLAAINNAIYYLKMVLPDAEDNVKEYMEMISSEIDNAKKIVSDLLDFSRIKPGNKENVAVFELVSKVLEDHPPPKEIKLTTKVPPGLPPVYADPRQIGQVLSNLITNAYQAMPGGGSLSIKAESIKKNVRISLSDTGCGIASKDYNKIFEPLFTTKDRGVGLGLTITRNMVQANGGNIDLISKKGKGATFIISLPTKEEL